MQSDNFLYQSAIPYETVGKGIKRQIMGYNEDIMMVKVEFETGSIGTAHTHPHVQTTYVVSGKFEVEIGNKKEILQTGDGFLYLLKKMHGVKCLEKGILIDVFNPVRKDFLTPNK